MKHRSRVSLTLAALAVALFLTGIKAAAEELYSDSGFFLELPEGFALNDGDGKSRFSFTDPNGAVLFQIFLFEPSRYPDATTMENDIVHKLGGSADAQAFRYQRRDASMAHLTFPMNGEPHEGWGLFINGAKKNAAGLAEKDIALLAYTSADRYEACLPFIFSCLDGFSVDAEARLYPGPVSQFNLPWNPAAGKPTAIAFDDRTLTIPVDPEEEAAAQATVEREYMVLASYANAAPELATAAWMRYYRMIYRETFHRLDYTAMVLSRELLNEPDARARAARLLAWTQGFKYDRDPEGSDLVNPLTAALEGRGDCDSRALLLAILARHDNGDALLLLSAKHSHALAAFDVKGPGARFPYAKKNWLVGETTAHVDIGLIDSTIADPADWLAVEFPRQ